MENKKTCFIISPIGQEGSDIRKQADDVFDFLIAPALSRFSFEIIRSDRIASTSKVSGQILNYIQNAELCIANLTGDNLTVSYQLGRRHETAKPCIQIISLGELTPFDVANMRTIIYDLNSFSAARDSQNQLEKYIEEIEKEGYSDSGSSLQNLSETLQRIEKKVNSLINHHKDETSPGLTKTELHDDNPVTHYHNAIDAGKYQIAADALRRYMQINRNYTLLLDMATVIIEKYDGSGIKIAKQIMNEHPEDITPSQYATTLFAMYQLYNLAMTLDDEKDYINSIINEVLKREIVEDQDKARLLNVRSSIEYSLNNFDKAIEYGYEAIELVNNEPVYYYNQAKTYEKTSGNTTKMFDNIDKLVELHVNESFTAPYIRGLDYATELYSEYKNEDEKIEEISQLIMKFSDGKNASKSL